MIDLCKYKDLFGIPGEGIHAFKIYGISVWDTLITIACALLIAWVTGWGVLANNNRIFFVRYCSS